MHDDSTARPTVVEEEPWYAFPPQPGEDWKDLKWGFLMRLASGQFVFDDSRRPTDEQIRCRKGCPLSSEGLKE